MHKEYLRTAILAQISVPRKGGAETSRLRLGQARQVLRMMECSERKGDGFESNVAGEQVAYDGGRVFGSRTACRAERVNPFVCFTPYVCFQCLGEFGFLALPTVQRSLWTMMFFNGLFYTKCFEISRARTILSFSAIDQACRLRFLFMVTNEASDVI